MAKAKTVKRETPRHGRFSWFALVLLLAALAGFFLALRPQSLESMWNRTARELVKRESVLTFAGKALSGGTLTVAGEGKDANSAEAVFALPDAAALSVTGKEAFELSAAGGKVTLRQGEEVSSADLSYALAAYDASHFSDEQNDLAYTLRRFLLLTESRADLGAAFEPYLKAVKRNLPREKREQVTGDGGSETVISYELDAKRLSAILTEWQKTLPGDETMREAVLDLFRSLWAACGESVPAGTVETVKSFLTGADGNQALLATGLAGDKGNVTVSFRTAGNRIIGVDAVWSLPFGGATGSGKIKLDLGRHPARAPLRSLEISEKWTQGSEEKTLYLSLRDELKEDSGSAYVREAEFVFKDPFLRLLPAADVEDGVRSLKLKYSWGKKRGDLGLRLVTENKTIQFRGELKDYKAGKRVEVALNRVEVDGENRIADQRYILTLRLGGEPAPIEPGDTALFREPEEESAGEEPASDLPLIP